MSYENPRIQLHHNMMDAMMILAEGNPGALTALMEIFKAVGTVDPDNALGPLGPLFSFDNLDIYGSNIWVLYKDVCGMDITKLLAVLRANQLGILSSAQIKTAITLDPSIYRAPGLPNLDEIVVKVKEELPDFGKNVPA